MARVSIFLITLVLMVGMVGCGTQVQYTLSVSSTSGGNVTHPGIGTFTYPAGAVVLLVAEPAEGYSFVNWTGNISTIADVNNATTTVIMNGHYFVTANFVQGQLIRNWYDLNAVRDDLGGYYILMNNLDSTTAGYEELASETANGGKGWQPIGNSTGNFTGTFDGQGHEIRDLFINRPGEESVGLFGYVGVAGVIKNAGTVDIAVTSEVFVGALVGYNLGAVRNSYSAGNVAGGGAVGGLVGNSESGIVSNCYATVS
ncbi:MAG TPA: GLUG motif-containing protein, partial [Dehalococcoidia bacterium]|nr:GLUG motif-containing protein [Dehalococcoidia bacterium]